ncbi:hypothetical protein FV232_17145 [Methylobacterium sp. WL30]|uniref:hypothetical protein n=1 Tax=unclassified Methylobacterium TaxID=2615210 RepID=UPI0011CC2AEA|nr:MULTISPECIES: hypothetical protein [unclassified Methylobacterium]TXN41707.1 hypothetical protein FV225_01565 [Methylobacterium sp. WL93]TXN51055.1 hypothetical protein FV227_09585 [Methylobacterium sp. WL119]TXN65817.1 hypothetical protein FV232_17145 [Methylobacterium sp. WL30]
MPDVYRNLTRACWSVRVKNRVVGHVPALVLRDVAFIVSLPGVRRIRLRQAREVIAYARGVPSESGLPNGALQVRFCPYRSTDFTLPDCSPIRAAAVASFLPDGSCWAVL